jgi:hypothetical protein
MIAIYISNGDASRGEIGQKRPVLMKRGVSPFWVRPRESNPRPRF